MFCTRWFPSYCRMWHLNGRTPAQAGLNLASCGCKPNKFCRSIELIVSAVEQIIKTARFAERWPSIYVVGIGTSLFRLFKHSLGWIRFSAVFRRSHDYHLIAPEKHFAGRFVIHRCTSHEQASTEKGQYRSHDICPSEQSSLSHYLTIEAESQLKMKTAMSARLYYQEFSCSAGELSLESSPVLQTRTQAYWSRTPFKVSPLPKPLFAPRGGLSRSLRAHF